MDCSDKSVLFATAFYHAPGQSPNAWTSSARSKLNTYCRCMVVCYASIRRLYPQSPLSLFTNRDLPEPYKAQLESLAVKTVICPGGYVDDSAFKNNFPGCIYTLDVIEYLASRRSDFTTLVLLDPDCVMRDRLDGMLHDLHKKERIYAYELAFPANMVDGGQSRATLTLALSYLTGKTAELPIAWYGGEFYAISAKLLPTLATQINMFWSWMKASGINIFGNGLTEEHVMSVALAQFGNTVHSATGWIKRIWTASIFSTVEGNESRIPVWHLPAEKKKGFVKLYRYWVAHNGFATLSDDAMHEVLDDVMSLHAISRKRVEGNILPRVRAVAKLLLTRRP